MLNKYGTLRCLHTVQSALILNILWNGHKMQYMENTLDSFSTVCRNFINILHSKTGELGKNWEQ